MIPKGKLFDCDIHNLTYRDGRVYIEIVVKVPDRTISGDIRREYVMVALFAQDLVR